ncbi:phosphonate metabolism transcriptional regulator PhnF [Burkholderia sp. L27(2015)]|uniref:phosphonate metabolism transcriptional regulator PhnF n=1 Tax=Burkholderia sp. L27(2015) TaxID=1641858 RepID=UPI0020B14AE7|nr:phosphonate metabolism transcriptional regulator PhnF [Burkholderia sp. L27(2015)]
MAMTSMENSAAADPTVESTTAELSTAVSGVERGAGVAVWLQIEQILAAEIAAQGFGDDGRLPSEAELAKRFSVNRHTIRRAMLGLAARGFVSVEQGRGTFVQPAAIDYSIGRRTRFTENLRDTSAEITYEVLVACKIKAEPVVAQALKLRSGTVVYQIDTVHSADGVPLSCARSWFPAMRFPDMPETLRRLGSTTAALAEFGVHDYTRQSSRIGSVLPDAETARRLGINRQQPTLVVENIDADLDDVPVKYGITHFAGDRVQLLVEPDKDLAARKP